MSSISSISPLTAMSSSAETASAQPAPATSKLGADTFLTLLVAQLKNQNPLNPMDGMQFVSQLAQFSQLETLFGIRGDLQAVINGTGTTTGSDPGEHYGNIVMRQIEVAAPVVTTPVRRSREAAPIDPAHALRVMADVPQRLQVLLDRVTMSMAEIASLKVGALVPLTKSAGDNVDVYVNGIALASAEIVVIDQAFNVRITDFVETEDAECQQ